MCTKLKQLRKDEKLYKAFYEKSVTFFSKILYPTEEILIGGEKNFHVSVITELVLWLNDTFSMVTSKVPNLEHVYMRPEVNSNWFEISNRFEMSFRLHGNLHGYFTAATFQTIAKLYCTCANDIFKLM